MVNVQNVASLQGVGAGNIKSGMTGRARPSSEREGGEEFSGAIAAADLLAAQSPRNSVVATALGSGSAPLEGARKPVLFGADQAAQPPQGGGDGSDAIRVKTTGRLDRMTPAGVGGSSEAGAQIQKMAVSLNTGADIAGLKPWSTDWVFEGGMNRHPLQKTLLPDSSRGESAGALNGLEELLRSVRARTAQDSELRQASAKMASSELMQGNLQTQSPLVAQKLQSAGMEALVNTEMRGNEAQAKAEVEAESEADVLAAFETQLQEAEPAGPSRSAGSMGSEEFLSVREGALPRGGRSTGAEPLIERESGANPSSRNRLELPSLGGFRTPSEQGGSAVQNPSGGSSMEGRPPTELKSKKSTLPDTLGLIHPHVSQTDSIPNIIPFEAKPNTLMLEGGVVAGAMSRNRISTESIGGIAQSIRQLSAGGEMRIRLKPDHLGELHVKVVTSGRGGAEVGLQIQASDERAKKILEESVGSLKEGLAAHHLSLSKLDVQIVPPSSQTTSFGDPSQDRQSQQGQPHLSSGFGQSSDRGSRQESTNSAETTHARGSASATQRQQFSRSTGGGAIRPMAASRLDVIA